MKIIILIMRIYSILQCYIEWERENIYIYIYPVVKSSKESVYLEGKDDNGKHLQRAHSEIINNSYLRYGVASSIETFCVQVQRWIINSLFAITWVELLRLFAMTHSDLLSQARSDGQTSSAAALRDSVVTCGLLFPGFNLSLSCRLELRFHTFDSKRRKTLVIY